MPCDYSKICAIGIDNGVSGGIAVVRGEEIRLYPMPVHRYPTPTSKRIKRKPAEVDIITLAKILDEIVAEDESWDYHTFLEEPLNFAASAQSLRSMAMCFGMIKAHLLVSKSLVYHDVQVRDWQSAMLGKFPAGGSKEAALLKATQLAPFGFRFVKSARSSKPNDGLVDAYLLAKYGLDVLK